MSHDPSRRVRRRSRLRGWWGVRWRRSSEPALFAVFAALALIGSYLSWADGSHSIRIAAVATTVVLLGSLLLTAPSMIALVAVMISCLLAVTISRHQLTEQVSWSGMVSLSAVVVVSIVQARRRGALGLYRTSAETVLERVRTRVNVQETVPELPAGWHVEAAQESANRAAFSGDFVSARVHDIDGRPFLDLVVVDVSGSGIDAGSRALLLSGAFGGLLGAVPASELLDRANDYLVRQDWGTGFASATYLQLDLTRWTYTLRSAGHPPALRWIADAGAIRHSTCRGTVLGVVSNLRLRADEGQLAPGDALVLYTDGMVEDRTQDLEAGLTRLEAAVSEALGPDDGVRDLAARLVRDAPVAGRDDRTAVIIWNDRRPAPRVEPADAEPARDRADSHPA